MADNDNGQEQEEGKKGGGIAGALVGAGTAYGTAAVASHVIAKGAPKKIEAATAAKLLAEHKYTKKLDELKLPGSPTKTSYDAFKTAEQNQIQAAADHSTVLATEWGKIYNTADHVKNGKLRIASLEGQLGHLGKMPVTADTKEATAAAKAQITAINDLIGKPEFVAMKPTKAIKELSNVHVASFKAQNVSEAAEGLLAKASVSPSAYETIGKAFPSEGAYIAERAKPYKDALGVAEKTLTEKKGEWEKVEATVLKTEKTAMTTAERSLRNLEALKGLSVKEGKGRIAEFIKGPLKAIPHMTRTAQFLVVGTTLLGAIVGYKAVQAMRGSPDSESHVERLEQERQTSRGAEPSPA